MNKYLELKEIQQKEFNNFSNKNMFYAFSDEQFNDMLAEFGLNKETMKGKLLHIAGTGGFLLKTKEKEFDKLNAKHKEEKEQAIKNDKIGNEYIKDMFSCELSNHEYGYTGDLTDTLDYLGLTLEQINNNKALKTGLKLALKRYEN